MRWSALLVAATLAGPACASGGWSPPQGGSAEATGAPQGEAPAARRLRLARAAAADAPGQPAEAHALAQAYLACGPARCFADAGDGAQAAESRGVLSALARAVDRAGVEDKATLLADRGAVLLTVGQDVAALHALTISVNMRPSLDAALPLIRLAASANKRADVARTCAQVRKAITSIEDRYTLLDACFVGSHAGHVEAGLAWATPEDREFYVRMRARRGKPVQGAARLDGTRPPPVTVDRQPGSEDEDPAAKLARLRAEQQHGICQARCRSLHQSCGKRKQSECAEDLNVCLNVCDAQRQR